MTFSVVLNGNTYNDASFNGNNYAIPATGLPAVMQDFVQHGANLWQASSVTSLSITGSGSVSLVCTINRPFLVGATVRLQRISDTTAFMQGPITAWNPTTGALSFTSNTSSNGLGAAGPWTDWQILALGLQGPTGATGGVGSFNSRTGAVTLTSGDVTGVLGNQAPYIYTTTIITANGTTIMANTPTPYFVDSSAGAFTITAPASATVGDRFKLIDVAGKCATNNVTIAASGLKFPVKGSGGAVANFVIDVNNVSLGFVYSGPTQGWVIE
jgi:hypothetical protein